MNKIKSFLAITFTVTCLSVPTYSQDQIIIVTENNCCFNILSAGLYLGWATSLEFYTQERTYWEDGPDGIIYNNLIQAGRYIQDANQTCNQSLPAWPDWKQKKYRLESIANSLKSDPSRFNRKQLAKSLKTTKSWSYSLCTVALPNRNVLRQTCAQKYFQMGWWIGYIQQTLLIAAEDLRVNGGQNWQYKVNHAKNYLGRLVGVLNQYKELRPITGHCADIDVFDIINRVSELQSIGYSTSNLNYMIGGMDWLRKEIQQRIDGDCSNSSSNEFIIPNHDATPHDDATDVHDDFFPNNSTNPMFPQSVPEPRVTSSNQCPRRNPGNKTLYKLNIVSSGTYLYCEYFRDGALRYQAPIVNGRKHGVILSYGTGQNKNDHPISSKRTFKHGIQDGLATYYSWCSGGARSMPHTNYKSSEVWFENGKKVPGSTKRFPSPCSN